MSRSPIRQLYERLRLSSEIPIIESPYIISKGLYLAEGRKKEIYIKPSLKHREKLKILLHEYSHHIHLTHHFKQESRAECEIIANGSAFLICREFGLKVCKEVDLSKFSKDANTVERVGSTIQAVARHILSGLKQDNQCICPLCNQGFTTADGMTSGEHLARGILKTYADMQGKGENENSLPCPRCGEYGMSSNVLRNTLSRHYDIHICDACENIEAVLVSEGKSIPLESWWVVVEILKRK